ncbi:hypothetical protein DDD63_08710 [Actinobaculum sp. 313]|nr:hypothetical protein DDD63_08710 [Actinobaculum sp. 313]
MRSFLERIEVQLAARASTHRDGYVSDLLFTGFDSTLALLLPLGTPSGVTTWSNLATIHGRQLSGATSLHELTNSKRDVRAPEGQIYDAAYAANLLVALDSRPSTEPWTALFWGGYIRHMRTAALPGPEDSFLRPSEPYALIRETLADMGNLTLASLPSLWFSPDLSIVITQPIYADRLYVSCGTDMATQLTNHLPDVFPIAPTDRLPIEQHDWEKAHIN